MGYGMEGGKEKKIGFVVVEGGKGIGGVKVEGGVLEGEEG